MVSKFWLVSGLAIDIFLFVNVAEATASETLTKISFVEVSPDWKVAALNNLALTPEPGRFLQVANLETAVILSLASIMSLVAVENNLD